MPPNSRDPYRCENLLETIYILSTLEVRRQLMKRYFIVPQKGGKVKVKQMKKTIKNKYSMEELHEIITSTVKEVFAERNRDSEKVKRLKAREREHEKHKAQRKKASMGGLDSLARGIVEAPVKVPDTDDPEVLRTHLAQALVKLKKLTAEVEKLRAYVGKVKGTKPGMDNAQCLDFVNTVEKATKGKLHAKK